MKLDVISTELAPAAIGTYSQAIRAGNTVYLSGQIPLIPSTMQLQTGDVSLQLKQVFENLSAVCQAAGGTLADVVKLTVYLVNLEYFSVVNEVMSHYFSAPYPARAVIGVAALPRGAMVEMDAIMVLTA